MRKIISFDKNAPCVLSSACVGGYEESIGPLSRNIDFIDKSDLFGQKTFEVAEAQMQNISLSLAIKKCKIETDEIEAVFAGDLENQCVASSSGLMPFGIPYVGLYSACSTCTESLLLLSSFISCGHIRCGASVTSSHNSAAERQFRTPLEYGAQRAPSAQWTATAAGSFILCSEGFYDERRINTSQKRRVRVRHAMIGKMVDGLTTDPSCMGAAMARAAYDSVYTYLSLMPDSCPDLIVTGDLGRVGSDILGEMIYRDFGHLYRKHIDCGGIIYDQKKQDSHAGASGCGCSALALSAHFLPMLLSGDIKDMMFLSTGALMSPSSVLQGNNIIGIAPVIHLVGEDI